MSVFVDIPKTTFKNIGFGGIEYNVTIYVGPVEPGHKVWANCFGYEEEDFYETKATWKQNLDLFGTLVEVWELQISNICINLDFDVEVEKKDNLGNIAIVKDNNEGNYFFFNKNYE